MKRLALVLVWATLAVALATLVVATPARADIRVNLITRLNELLDDANNRKMSQANKILFLDGTAQEYGRRGFFIKRDTILTVANQESYALNADCANRVMGAWAKRGQERTVLPVIDRDSAFSLPGVTAGRISYVMMDEDGKLGVHAVPTKVDTLVLLYYALPAALSGDSTEWDLPDYYEEPALYETAASCLLKVATGEAQAKASALLKVAGEKLQALQ